MFWIGKLLKKNKQEIYTCTCVSVQNKNHCLYLYTEIIYMCMCECTCQSSDINKKYIHKKQCK